MQIVTGRRGEPHVTSRQVQAVYRSFLGDFALLDIGNHLGATATANDNVRISDGVVAVQGIYAVIAYNEYDDNYIEPVSVGMKRIDTLILHYTKSNDIEDMQIEVVEGEEVVDNPVAPTIAEGGDAWEGTADIKVPIYDVLVTSFGLTVTPYSRMNTLIPTLDSIAERIPERIVTGVKGDSEALYRNGNVNITKENIGLGNVDNTADTDKPISTATQTALDLKASIAYVDALVASAYHAGGSKTVAELTSSLLIADNMGKVYNMSDSGVTTSDFVEGAGKSINEGDNVGVCNVGTEENPVYKFDLLSGFVDLSAYVTTTAMNTALADKVDKVAGKGLSTEDYTTEEKTKLAGIEAQANKTVVDSAMSDSSTNPLQNKVITAELAGTKTTNGNPVTVTDAAPVNAVDVSVDVEPIQDLHGYDHPWVGGAGKNLFEVTATSQTVNGVTFTPNSDGSITLNGQKTADSGTIFYSLGTFTAKAGKTYTLSGTPSSSTSGTYIYNDGDWINTSNPTKTFADNTNNRMYLRIQGSPIFNNTIFKPQIEEGSTATAFEPYTNICPISGRSEVEIDRVGKNLFDGQFENGYYDSSGKVYSLGWKRSADYINVVSGQSYVLSGELETLGTHDSNGIFFYAEDGSYIAYALFNINSLTFSKSVVTPQNCAKIGFYFRANANIKQTQLELGSTATTYEPYAGKTYTIQFGQTVYGAHLDATKGGLVVDKGYVEFDGSSDENWSRLGGSTPWGDYTMYISLNGVKYDDGDTTPNIISNYLGAIPFNPSWASYDAFLSKNPNSDALYTGIKSITTVADWRTYLASNPLQVCYELVTPFTIDLTPQQIKLLENTNTLYTDYEGDTITIEYQPNNAIGEAVRVVEESYDAIIQNLIDRITALENS